LSTQPQTLDQVLAPAPVTGWRRVAGDWMLVGGTTLACQALGALSGLLLRMILDPAQMGVWQGVKLFLGYGNYTNLGVSKGAAREYNVALGHGDTTSAERGLRLAFTVNTITSLLYAVVLSAAGVRVALGGGPWATAWGLGLVLVGLMAAGGRYVTFHVTLLRCKQAFAVTSQLSILEAGLTLAVCTLAAWRWGLLGLYAGTFSVVLASAVFVVRRRAVTLGWAWDMAEIRRLVAIGAPILLAGTAGTLFRSLDKLMILGYLSDREFQLGCYSLGLMVSVQLYGLGNMLSVVMGPRYGEMYGRSGDRREVARLAARTTELQAAGMTLAAAAAMVAAPPVLVRLLPDYQVGLAPLMWLAPGAVALSLALPATQYLIAVNRQGRALAAVLAALGFAAVTNHVALVGGWGLVGVAGTTAASYLAYFVLALAVSIWIELDAAERLRMAVVLSVVMVPPLSVAAALERCWPGDRADLTTTLAKLAAVGVVWSLVAAYGWQRGRWGRGNPK
jgi:O-antigen/teichoic acid export membrane protein